MLTYWDLWKEFKIEYSRLVYCSQLCGTFQWVQTEQFLVILHLCVSLQLLAYSSKSFSVPPYSPLASVCFWPATFICYLELEAIKGTYNFKVILHSEILCEANQNSVNEYNATLFLQVGNVLVLIWCNQSSWILCTFGPCHLNTVYQFSSPAEMPKYRTEFDERLHFSCHGRVFFILFMYHIITFIFCQGQIQR